jgi:hypothetical protein
MFEGRLATCGLDGRSIWRQLRLAVRLIAAIHAMANRGVRSECQRDRRKRLQVSAEKRTQFTFLTGGPAWPDTTPQGFSGIPSGDPGTLPEKTVNHLTTLTLTP